MSIPNEVASEFAKLVTSNDSKETEQTVYGTIVLQDGVKYVRFDGSEILTPVSTTTNVENNERVTVLIKEHQAIVTGNITSPAARTQEVTAVNDKFDNYSTTEEMNSKISQTAESITTEVNKTLSGYVTGDDVDDALKDHPTVAQMNSAIEQKAESITSTVNKTLTNYSTTEQVADKIADISIGGTNLLPDTRLMSTDIWRLASSRVKDIGREGVDEEGFMVIRAEESTGANYNPTCRPYTDYQPLYKDVRGKQITFSLEVDTTATYINIEHRIMNTEDVYKKYFITYIPLSGQPGWQRVSETFTLTDDLFDTGSGEMEDDDTFVVITKPHQTPVYRVRKIKMELGNKATDWSPAPEDVDNTLKNYPTKTEMNSTITQKADSITSEVNKTLTNYSTIEQMNTKVTQTAESLSAEISGITIGGTNLAADTRLMERWSYSSSGARPITRHVDDEGYGVLSWSSATTTTWVSARPSRDDRKPYALFRNKEATVSFEFRGPNWVNNDYMMVYFWLDEELSDHARYGSIGFRPPKTSEWVKMEQTVTVTDAMFVSGSGTLRDEAMLNVFPAVNALGAFEIRKFKVELGNKATDWSPAPEDGAYTTSAVLDRSGIHLKTGGTFTVDSQNFDVDGQGKMTAKAGSIGGWEIASGSLKSGSSTKHVRLSTEDATYAIWAGAEASGSAPFRVARDGTVYLTKLYVTDETGKTQSSVNLRTSYWKVDKAYGRSVQSMTVSGNTLTITLYDGTTVNFNKATVGSVTVTYAGQPGQVQVTVKDTNGGTMFSGNVADGGLFNTALKAGTPTATIAESSGSYSITPSIMYNGTKVKDGTAVSGNSIYNAGWNGCRNRMTAVSCIIPSSTITSELFYANGQSAGTGFYRGTPTTLYNKPSAK